MALRTVCPVWIVRLLMWKKLMRITYYDPTKKKEDVFGRLNGYVKETGAWWWADESRSTATGMIKTLPAWINDKILDGEQKDRFGIYLNRPKMYAFILILNFEIL